MAKNCFNCKHYDQPSLSPPHICVECMRRKEPFSLWEAKSITNYDRLISKSPEELAKWLNNHSSICAPGKEPCLDGECGNCWLDWLREEANNGQN